MTDRPTGAAGQTRSDNPREPAQERGNADDAHSGAPFSPGAIDAHIKSLDVRARSIDDKIGYLCRRAAGKRVLDVGVVEHHYEATKSGAWLHRHLSRSAASCLGIDILGEPVARLRADGYNVIVHNLCDHPLEDEFDLIVMGELIEHVTETGKLLTNASHSLADDGRILITTPNPWYINTLQKAVRHGFFVGNTDHVAWYDPATMLTLAHRCDLDLVAFAGLSGMKPRTILGKAVGAMVSGVSRMGLFPLLDSNSLLYEFKKRS